MEYFDYDQVPSTFSHCIAEKCPLQADCLRWIAYQYITPEVEQVHIINPLKIAAMDKNKCPYFFKVQPIRYAKGFKHVLDRLPHEEVRELRKELIAYLGHTRYYRFLKGEKLIPPREQKMIQGIFEGHGFSEALHFQEYVDTFVFHPSEIKMSTA